MQRFDALKKMFREAVCHKVGKPKALITGLVKIFPKEAQQSINKSLEHYQSVPEILNDFLKPPFVSEFNYHLLESVLICHIEVSASIFEEITTYKQVLQTQLQQMSLIEFCNILDVPPKPSKIFIPLTEVVFVFKERNESLKVKYIEEKIAIVCKSFKIHRSCLLLKKVFVNENICIVYYAPLEVASYISQECTRISRKMWCKENNVLVKSNTKVS